MTGKRLLPTVRATADAEDITEAFGGTGEAADEPVDHDSLHAAIIATLRTIHDPEIPVNIYDLGLIYGFDIADDGRVDIDMTLTAPACPVAGMLVTQVADRVGELDGVSRSHVRLVWDPPWTRERMSEDAQLALGLI